MVLDPSNPPIWLRKLHVTAEQLSPADYPSTPEEGILLVCRLSDDHLVLSQAFAAAPYPRACSTDVRNPE